jgi:CBS domain-containing protein
MTLHDILRVKGKRVHSIGPDATLDDVVQALVGHNCGSLVVCQRGECSPMLGIITERDILRAVAARKAPLDQLRVADQMSADLVTGSPCDSVEDTMGLLTERRIRHLPILEDGELVGLVSIGDIVKAQHDHLTMENHYLKTYIQS